MTLLLLDKLYNLQIFVFINHGHYLIGRQLNSSASYNDGMWHLMSLLFSDEAITLTIDEKVIDTAQPITNIEVTL